jgi:uncharacterized membrane protein YeaQ/YmgE (transglycosylase-associated protein family)
VHLVEATAELCERGIHGACVLLLEAGPREPTVRVVSFVADLLSMALLGLIIGGLARFALPGPPRLSLWWTAALGVAGTVFGGLIGKALFGSPGVPLLAVLTSMAILSAYGRVERQRSRRPTN